MISAFPRAGSPKQWQQSLVEANYFSIPSEISEADRRRTPIPENLDQLSVHERLMYTDKILPSKGRSTASLAEASQTFKLSPIPSKNPRKMVSHGHESSLVVKPNNEHLKAFKDGLESTAPLAIITHVKVGVKQPKMASGNTSPSICSKYLSYLRQGYLFIFTTNYFSTGNFIGGFYATA